MTHTCPACSSVGLLPFFELTHVPVHQNLLYGTVEAARQATRGNIALAFCPACGFVTNTAFDSALLNYSADYDNTQCYSPLFSTYISDLADDLIERHNLRRKQVVEIGCGKGDFIRLLCERGPNSGFGFDPSYIGDERALDGRLTFIKDFYDERYSHYAGDFFCTRHVIEHIAQPAAMLTSLRRAIGEREKVAIFFETPDVTWILRHAVFWDVFYEHCSLFSPGSLARLYAASGFDTTRAAVVFGDQYMWVEGAAAVGRSSEICVPVESAADVLPLIDDFSARCAARMADARTLLDGLAAENQRVVLWGAGAKGVTFLNSLSVLVERIPYVVDINARKQGRYVPGTGQQIIAPEALSGYHPDVVLVMNPNYLEEIHAAVGGMSLSPDVIAL
jgi:SAM-dependent methyltransferase